MSFKIDAAQYIVQERNAQLLMIEYEAYAREIGCRIFQDEIEATPEQATLLWRKWNALTGQTGLLPL